MDITKFFHRLMNPHCPHCFAEKQSELDRQECKSCEILQRELERAHDTINRLLNPKVSETIPKVEDEEELRPIPTNRRMFTPSAVRQQMQDKADQRTLDLLIASKKKIEEVSNEPVVDEKKIAEMERDILSAPEMPKEVVNG